MTFNITVVENLKPYVCWQVKINGKNALKVTIGGLMNLINATDQFMILGVRLISLFSLLIRPRNISWKDKFLKFVLFLRLSKHFLVPNKLFFCRRNIMFHRNQNVVFVFQFIPSSVRKVIALVEFDAREKRVRRTASSQLKIDWDMQS